jgi:hypothetical protein
MEGDNLKIFNSDGNDVVLPSIDAGEKADSKLISESIDTAILGDKVKKLIVPEDLDIEEVNIVLDISSIKESMSVFTTEVIKSLLVARNGDTAIYMYNISGMVKIGYGRRHELERTLPVIKEFALTDGLRIYKDYKRGKEIVEVRDIDVSMLRLNL